VGAGELRGAAHDLDLSALEQRLDTAGELLHDALLALEQPPPVDLRLADLDPVFPGAPDLLEQVGRDDPGLGRNAAPVEAGGAEFVLLHHRGLEPELRGADRRDVAAGTGADDDHLIVAWIA